MNVECLSDPHSSVILVQKVDHNVCYSYDLLTQFLLFQPKMNALSKEMSVPQRCFASIERDRLLVAVILVLRWLAMKRRGLAKVPLLFWVSIIWCLVCSPPRQTTPPPPPITATMVVKFERTLWERYRSILTAGEQLPKRFMNNYFSPGRVWQARRQLPLWFTMLKTGQWITRLWLFCWLQGDRRGRVEILPRYHCKRLVPNCYLCVFGAKEVREDWG